MNLPWLDPGDPFPDPSQAWDASQPAPGLLAAGGALDIDSLHRAYSSRHLSLVQRGPAHPVVEHRSAHGAVHRRVQAAPVAAQDPGAIHRQSTLRVAHGQRLRRGDPRLRRQPRDPASPAPGSCRRWSPPTRLSIAPASRTAWKPGSTAAGGRPVLRGDRAGGVRRIDVHARSDASKIALAALIAFCRHHGIALIDCQQNTPHLASLGAREIARAGFVAQVHTTQKNHRRALAVRPRILERTSAAEAHPA